MIYKIFKEKMMQVYLPELLTKVNEDVSLLNNYKGDATFTLLFKHAFDPAHKFILPEGDPPFKPDAAPIGMSPAVLRQELKKLYVFCRADLKPIRREQLFVQLLENVHPSEAALLMKVKDQTLTEAYPNITHQLAFDMGFINVPPSENIPPAIVKRGRGRPKKSIGVVL